MVKNYFEVRALSNSALSYLDPKSGGSDQKFLAWAAGQFRKQSMGFDLGSMVHAYLLEPQNTVEIDELPAGKIKLAIEEVYKYLYDMNYPMNNFDALVNDIRKGIHVIEESNGYPQEIISADLAEIIAISAKKVEYQNRWKNPAKIRKIWVEGKTYLQLMMENESDQENDDGEAVFFLGNKQAITKKAKELALHFKQQINTSELLYNYLFNDRFVEGGTARNEEAILWTMNDIDMKCKVDRYIVNPRLKEIYHFDMKTSNDHPEKFGKSIFNYSYYRQVGVYDVALRSKYGLGWTIKHYLVPMETNENSLNEVGCYEIDKELVEAGVEEFKALANRANMLLKKKMQPKIRFHLAKLEGWQRKTYLKNLELIRV